MFLFEHIAEKIEQRTKRQPDRRLPSIRALAEQYQVSVPTVTKAFRVLKEKGIIKVYRKRGAFPSVCSVPRPSHIRPRRKRKFDLLLEDVQRKIIDGVYRRGTPLPKYVYWTTTYNVSHHTVRNVYDSLIEKNMVHRRGKSFIVGNAAIDSVYQLSPGSRVILVIQEKKRSWMGLFNSQHMSDFALSFVREADQNGVRLVPFAVDEASESGSSVVWMLKQSIAHAGSLFQGCLLVMRNEQNQTEIEEIVNFLSSINQPTVWLDANGTGFPVDSDSGKIFRAYYSETAVCRTALEYLIGTGHRRIAYYTTNKTGWQFLRLQCLISQSEKLSGDARVIPAYSITEEFWSAPERHGFDGLCDRCLRSPRKKYHEALAVFLRHENDLLREHGSMIGDYSGRYRGFLAFSRAFLKKRGLSASVWYKKARIVWAWMSFADALEQNMDAVLGANDEIAERFVFEALDSLGLQMPRRISVLGFDNIFRKTLLPLSSVDLGFGPLGYRVFNTICRDTFSKETTSGEMAIRPYVVNRGSVIRRELCE